MMMKMMKMLVSLMSSYCSTWQDYKDEFNVCLFGTRIGMSNEQKWANPNQKKWKSFFWYWVSLRRNRVAINVPATLPAVQNSFRRRQLHTRYYLPMPSRFPLASATERMGSPYFKWWGRVSALSDNYRFFWHISWHLLAPFVRMNSSPTDASRRTIRYRYRGWLVRFLEKPLIPKNEGRTHRGCKSPSVRSRFVPVINR